MQSHNAWIRAGESGNRNFATREGDVAYNCLPLWIALDRTEPWTSREQWPRDPDYKPSVSLPANALCQADGKAVLKYVETKAVVGGVTAIQGSAKVGPVYEGWMVRNVEDETFGTGKKTVNQSVLPFTSAADYAAAKSDLDAGHAFLYHLSEGTDPSLIADYNGVRDHNVLAPKFLGIHSTALAQAQFAEWHPRGGSVIWSPFSNIWLYGRTTDVLAARNDRLRDVREIGGVVGKGVKLRDHGRRYLRNERRLERGIIPGLVRPQLEKLVRPAFPLDCRGVRLARALARGFERAKDLGPAHVSARDSRVDQIDGPRKAGADGDRLRIDGVRGGHELISAVHRVAVDRD